MNHEEKKYNGREARTISIKDFRIKSKKDWVVFWVMTALVDYGFVARFFEKDTAARLAGFLGLGYAGLRVAIYYGRLVAGVVLMGIVVEVVCFLCHKPVWVKLGALAAVVLLSLALAGGCWAHVHYLAVAPY